MSHSSPYHWAPYHWARYETMPSDMKRQDGQDDHAYGTRIWRIAKCEARITVGYAKLRARRPRSNRRILDSRMHEVAAVPRHRLRRTFKVYIFHVKILEWTIW
eukprot:scaffold2179_cov165-Amphora_coffeaeformis.AAC.16